MKLLILAAASLAVVSCASLSLEDQEFHAWKLEFGKVYRSPEEEARRKDIWLSTRRTVLAHNILADQGIKTYRMGMSHLSDMDTEEYLSLLGDLVPYDANSPSESGRMFSGEGRELPKSVDWRKSGCVTRVKDQGACGSCWAFSATGALESHTCIKYDLLRPLSEQQLVDCSDSDGNEGCNGGHMHSAFQYVMDNGGIDIEKYYPYEEKDSYCRYSPLTIGAYCKGYRWLPYGDESVLEEALAYEGPVSVAIDANHTSFQHYSSGVFFEPECSSSEASHAVLAVGYGTTGEQDYWLVKNSWSEYWGEKGYVKMARNKNNSCAIASYPIFPLV